MEKAVIEGYGPPDLIDRVRDAAWVACTPTGKNFHGIVCGGRVLTDTPDEWYTVKFRVSLATVPRGKRLTMEGYNDWEFLKSIQHDTHAMSLAGCRLRDDYIGEVNAYRVTVEVVRGPC